MLSYQFTNELASAVGQDRRELRDAYRVLDYSALQSLAFGIRGQGTSPGTLSYVLAHIIERTLPFKKHIEHIRLDDYSGKETLGLPGLPVCQRTVQRALGVLRRLGYIVETVADSGRVRMYGPNLPVLLDKLKEMGFDRMGSSRPGAEERQELFHRVHAAFDKLRSFYESLNRSIGRQYRKVLDEIKSYFGGCMSRLSDAVDQKKKQGKERAEAKDKKRAETLKSWEDWLRAFRRTVNDTEKYPKITIPFNKKYLRYMKDYIRELRANDMSDQDILDYFRYIAENWIRIGGNHLTTRKGKQKQIPLSPEFEFLWYYRHKVYAMIDPATLPEAPEEMQVEKGTRPVLD